MLRISLREGVVHRYSPTFQVVVVRHHWYEPRARFKVLLADDPRRLPEPVPFVIPKRQRRKRRA